MSCNATDGRDRGVEIRSDSAARRDVVKNKGSRDLGYTSARATGEDFSRGCPSNRWKINRNRAAYKRLYLNIEYTMCACVYYGWGIAVIVVFVALRLLLALHP